MKLVSELNTSFECLNVFTLMLRILRVGEAWVAGSVLEEAGLYNMLCKMLKFSSLELSNQCFSTAVSRGRTEQVLSKQSESY